MIGRIKYNLRPCDGGSECENGNSVNITDYFYLTNPQTNSTPPTRFET